MVDINKLAEQARIAMGNNSGVRVEVVNLPDPAKIGKLLGTKPAQTSADGAEQKPIASKEKATYKDMEGMLIRYTDGSLEFQATKKNEKGQNIRTSFNFKNEKSYKKQTPQSKVIYRAKKSDGKTTYEKSGEETYSYYHNGKVSHSEYRNGKGKVVNVMDYYNDGKPKQKMINDKDGNLQSTFKYEKVKDGTQAFTKYDNQNNIVSTGNRHYSGDKLIASESYYVTGAKESELTYYDNGLAKTQKMYHPNGQLKSNTDYYDNGVIRNQVVYDENGNVVSRITPEIDGHFDNSAQKSEGDCYLMASINSIRQTTGGQELLSNLIKISTNSKGEKVYTVTFPGAKLAAEGLKNDSRIKPGTIAITGTYTFTESEMQEILKKAGLRYSLGDGDAILLEAAFEKYRMEVRETLLANNIDPSNNGLADAGLVTGKDEDNILASGRPEDAMFILTGKKSELYNDNKVPNGLSYEDLQAGNAVVKPRPKKQNMVKAKATPEVSSVSSKKTELDRMLDSVMNDAKDGSVDNIAIAGFRTIRADGTEGGHALTIKSVTADTVVMVNPWHPDKEVVMSREDFKNSVMSVTFMDSAQPAKPTQNSPSNNNNNHQEQVINYINHIIHNNNGNNGNNGSPTTPAPAPQSPTPPPTTPTPAPQSQTPQPPATPEPPHATNNSSAGRKYKVQRGMGYTQLIRDELKKQGIEPTKENIQKAKAQFKSANPGKVHVYNGKNEKWRGNETLWANEEVVIPEFKM